MNTSLSASGSPYPHPQTIFAWLLAAACWAGLFSGFEACGDDADKRPALLLTSPYGSFYGAALRSIGLPFQVFSNVSGIPSASAQFYSALTNEGVKPRIIIVDLINQALSTDANVLYRTNLVRYLSEGGAAILPYDSVVGPLVGAGVGALSPGPEDDFGGPLFDWGGTPIFDSDVNVDFATIYPIGALVAQQGLLGMGRVIAGISRIPEPRTGVLLLGGSGRVIVQTFPLALPTPTDLPVTHRSGAIQFAIHEIRFLLSQETNETPRILASSRRAKPTLGGSTVMQARMAGRHDMAFQWRRPGGDPILGGTNAYLIVRNASVADEGEYGVSVSNLYGSVTGKVARLDVLAAPRIQLLSGSVHAPINTSVSIAVAAEGATNLAYRWLDPVGQTIAAATGPSVVLSNLQPSAAGTYTVVITNKYGTATGSVDVAVSQALTLAHAANPSPTNLTLRFNKLPAGSTPGTGALDPVHYQLNGGASVLKVERAGDDAGLVLTTSDLSAMASITVTITGLSDDASPSNSLVPDPTIREIDRGEAGRYVADFDDPSPGVAEFFGVSAPMARQGGVGGMLSLMVPQLQSHGHFKIPGFSGEAPITHFKASFDLLMGGGTGLPADGFSFNVSSNLPQPRFRQPGEDGVTTNLAISFDTYPNTDSATSLPAPSIRALLNGKLLASYFVDGQGQPATTALVTNPATGFPLSLETVPQNAQDMDRFVPVVIELRPDSTLWVTYDGTLVISNLITGTPALPLGPKGGFLFSSRTGLGFEHVWIDNLQIETFSYPRPPYFLNPNPTNRLVIAGGSTTLTANVAGSPPLLAQWYRNDERIEGATSLTYTPPPLMGEREFEEFRIVISNANGTASRTAIVRVVHPPTIVSAPPSVTAVVGADVSFTVVVTNNATLPVSYRWRRNGTTLFATNLYAREMTLILTNITAASAGSYTVVVTNNGVFPGFLSQPPAVLTVVESTAPPTIEITSPVDGASFVVAEAITLKASAQDPDGSIARVEFFQDGQILGADGAEPFEWIWTAPGPGTFEFTARAIDNLGAKTTSAAIHVRVQSPRPLRITEVIRTFEGVQLTWESEVGQGYLVEYKDSLDDAPWKPLSDPRNALGVSMTFEDSSASSRSQRFYRVRRL